MSHHHLISRSTLSVLAPVVTSDEAAASSTEGSSIVYTATATCPMAVGWGIEDDAETGCTIDLATGVMSGGEGALAGDYVIALVVGTEFSMGRTAFSLTWTVVEP